MSAIPLEIKNIYKSFAEKEILEDINLIINPNEIFGFIGLNGAGKTTLIKIIIDLLEADCGDINIFGESKINPKSRDKISYLPEKFQPSNHLTAIDFIKLNLGFNNIKFDPKKAEILAKNLDFDPKLLSKKISTFSKGMTQKIGLIASFLTENKLIILDEPMSGLDPKARITLKQQLLNYKKQGNSVFFSSHILSDIDEICDRIAILNDHKIIFIGTSEELKKKQKTKNLEKAFIQEISSPK